MMHSRIRSPNHLSSAFTPIKRIRQSPVCSRCLSATQILTPPQARDPKPAGRCLSQLGKRHLSQAKLESSSWLPFSHHDLPIALLPHRGPRSKKAYAAPTGRCKAQLNDHVHFKFVIAAESPNVVVAMPTRFLKAAGPLLAANNTFPEVDTRHWTTLNGRYRRCGRWSRCIAGHWQTNVCRWFQ